MIVVGVEAELRLNGGRVDTILVEAVANGTSKFHVSCGTFSLEVKVDLNVQTRDELGVTQLPDMQVMATNDTGEFLDVFLDVIDAETCGDCLKKDARCSLAEGDGRGENNTGDNQRNTRIGVVTPGEVGKPDEQCRANDTNVAQCIAHDVQEDTTHVEVVVRMAVAATL